MKIIMIVLALIIVGAGGLWAINKKPVPEIINKQMEDLQPSVTGKDLEKSAQTVPLPTGEDIIRTFFNLISEKRIPDAVKMLNGSLAPDENSQQAWAVQFNRMQTVTIKNIEPWMESNWTDEKKTYKVTLSIDMSADSANAPIVYYGWDGDPDIRWVSIVRGGDGLWEISEIATGP